MSRHASVTSADPGSIQSKLCRLDTSEGIGLFTDGSGYCKDRSGGWAWVAIDAFDGEVQASGGACDTTSNRMEMTAWIEGLNALHQALGPCDVVVFADSQYVGLGATDRTRNRKVNCDLWTEIDTAVNSHSYVEFSHVKGHAGHWYNELVDQLAGKARRAQIIS